MGALLKQRPSKREFNWKRRSGGGEGGCGDGCGGGGGGSQRNDATDRTAVNGSCGGGGGGSAAAASSGAGGSVGTVVGSADASWGLVVVSTDTQGEVLGELEDSGSWQSVDLTPLPPLDRGCSSGGDNTPPRSRGGGASIAWADGSDTDGSRSGREQTSRSPNTRRGIRSRLKLGGLFGGGGGSIGGSNGGPPFGPPPGSAGSRSPEPPLSAAAEAARRTLALTNLDEEHDGDGGCGGNGGTAGGRNGGGNGGGNGSGGGGSGGSMERVPGLYAALLASADATDEDDMKGIRGSKRISFADIEKDIHRTLRMENVAALRNVLRVLSLSLPDVGYCQGMNFLCRKVLQTVHGSEENAYWILLGMMHRFRLRGLYVPGMPGLQARFFQLRRLMRWHLPELYERFEVMDITPNLYATPWFVTLLSDGSLLPEAEIVRAWDLLFLHAGSPAEQWAVVFRIVLELLARAAPRLLHAGFDECVQRLMSLPFAQLCGGPGSASGGVSGSVGGGGGSSDSPSGGGSGARSGGGSGGKSGGGSGGRSGGASGSSSGGGSNSGSGSSSSGGGGSSGEAGGGLSGGSGGGGGGFNGDNSNDSSISSGGPGMGGGGASGCIGSDIVSSGNGSCEAGNSGGRGVVGNDSGGNASSRLAELLAKAAARFEMSVPMTVQLTMLHDEWEDLSPDDRGWAA
ncbi:unnamed protein product [Phaeothamnion confervicola]